MDTQDEQRDERVVRTSISIPESVDAAIRQLAHKHDRPLSREIRRAIEAHVEASKRKAAA